MKNYALKTHHFSSSISYPFLADAAKSTQSSITDNNTECVIQGILHCILCFYCLFNAKNGSNLMESAENWCVQNEKDKKNGSFQYMYACIWMAYCNLIHHFSDNNSLTQLYSSFSLQHAVSSLCLLFNAKRKWYTLYIFITHS